MRNVAVSLPRSGRFVSGAHGKPRQHQLSRYQWPHFLSEIFWLPRLNVEVWLKYWLEKEELVIQFQSIICYAMSVELEKLCVATVSVRFLLLIILKWFPTYKLWCDLRRLKTCVHSFINCSKNLNLIKTIQSLEKLMT